MENQAKILKFVPKVVAAETPITEEVEEFGGADLEKIYRDLYNFQMCAFCGIPTNKTHCSESCFVEDMKSE